MNQIVITVADDGAMQITGPLHDKKWCMKCLDMAKETIKNHKGSNIVVPSYDVDKQTVHPLKFN